MVRLLAGVVRRVLGGGQPQPWWMPRRLLTVVSADVDAGAGVGAVWMVWRPGAARESVPQEHIAFVEWYEEQWRYVGGGISSANDPADVDVDVIEVRGGSGALSLTRRLDPPRSFETAPWIACVCVYLGPDVDHILVGDRRFDASGQRRVVAVWKGPQIRRGVRPVIVAVGCDGGELSRIGPLDSLDSRTWARVWGESEGP
ncbi:hypothetical protein [Streptomyces sp. NBC_00576]|uniref:hypothetical protein n=1 Tax=Streptomyces sp. NBC_00576 TaxID=2903665 RepID=UPI002E815517|nr:hypothetical protein [Streptomyces sp. NBC_00576]WUB72543.1 hypothetical protein OG734_21840 [Streptomyces sp. NBC_00576]